MRPLTLLLAAALLALPMAGCLDSGAPGGGDGNGDPVSFSLVDTDGVARNATDYRGEPLVLFMMATWCGTCERKAPTMQELHEEYGDAAGFLGVGIDPSESDQALERQKNAWGHQWPYAIDRDSLGARFNAYTSTVVILDPDGRVAFNEYNPKDAAMRSALDKLLEG